MIWIEPKSDTYTSIAASKVLSPALLNLGVDVEAVNPEIVCFTFGGTTRTSVSPPAAYTSCITVLRIVSVIALFVPAPGASVPSPVDYVPEVPASPLVSIQHCNPPKVLAAVADPTAATVAEDKESSISFLSSLDFLAIW